MKVADKIAELQTRCVLLSGIVEAQRQELTRLKTKNEVVYSPYIPDEIMRRLKILCQPERHGNSKMATIATNWLNDQ